MSEETTNKNVREDEIDLLDLFRRIGNGLAKMFKTLGRWSLISFVFLVKRWLPLTISVIIGFGVSYLLKFSADPSYQTELIVKPNTITITEVSEQIKKLQDYIVEKNYKELVNSLNISQNEAANLLEMVALHYIDRGRDGVPDYIDYDNSFNPLADTMNVLMEDRAVIYCRIKEPQVLSSIKNGIIKYFNSDSLFQQRNRLRTKQNVEILNRINFDITRLDSLQKILYFEDHKNRQPQNGGQMIFLQEQKTQLLYDDIYSLYNRKKILEENVEIYKDIITVQSDFTVPKQRLNGGLFYAKRVVPASFVLAILILILISNKNNLKELFDRYE